MILLSKELFMNDDINVIVKVELTLPLGLANEIDRESRRSGRGWPDMLSAMLIEAMAMREMAELDAAAGLRVNASNSTLPADSLLQF